MTEHDCDKLGKNRIFLTTEDNWVHRIPYGIWVLETKNCSYLEDISFCPFCGLNLKVETNLPDLTNVNFNLYADELK